MEGGKGMQEWEILVAIVPRTDIEQLMRNRKEASKTIFGQIVFEGSSPLISWESENWLEH